MEFVRFGGLSSVRQKGYDPSMPGFHSPPASRGIYAFPLGQIVPFMLGGSRGTAKGIARYVKDKQGNRISYEENEDLYKNTEGRPMEFASGEKFYPDRNFYKVYSTEKNRDGKSYWRRPAPMKRFTHKGELWHHLGANLKPHQILERKGTWVKSSVEDWKKAFDKESLTLRNKSIEFDIGFGETRGKFGVFNTDHLEVFIEKV